MPAGSSAQGVLVSRFGHAPKTAFLRSSCVMLALVLVLMLVQALNTTSQEQCPPTAGFRCLCVK